MSDPSKNCMKSLHVWWMYNWYKLYMGFDVSNFTYHVSIFILGFQILRQSLSFLSQVSTFNIHVEGRIVWLIFFFVIFWLIFDCFPCELIIFISNISLWNLNFLVFFLNLMRTPTFPLIFWIKVQWLTVFKNKGTIWK